MRSRRHPTSILILDEATAFTDPDAEAHIQDALAEASTGKTVLVDVREIGIDALRVRVAIVFQDVLLASVSVADAIRLGRLEASDAEVVAAAGKAQAHDFIEDLPHGYATASVDAVSEAALQRAIDALLRDKTVVIAHRLRTVRRADKILVLDAGRIVEDGRHDDLLAADGPYARLWREQQRIGGWRLERRQRKPKISTTRALPTFERRPLRRTASSTERSRQQSRATGSASEATGTELSNSCKKQGFARANRVELPFPIDACIVQQRGLPRLNQDRQLSGLKAGALALRLNSFCNSSARRRPRGTATAARSPDSAACL